jgi:hypothetical protein
VDGHRISGIAVEALFWIRLIHLLGSSIDFRFLPHPRWHALDFSAGFLIVGAAMAGVLLSAPSRNRSRRLAHESHFRSTSATHSPSSSNPAGTH